MTFAAVASSTSIALERRVTTGSHTIILVQLLPEITSRTFHDFESLDGALDGKFAITTAKRQPGSLQTPRCWLALSNAAILFVLYCDCPQCRRREDV